MTNKKMTDELSAKPGLLSIPVRILLRGALLPELGEPRIERNSDHRRGLAAHGMRKDESSRMDKRAAAMDQIRYASFAFVPFRREQKARYGIQNDSSVGVDDAVAKIEG